MLQQRCSLLERRKTMKEAGVDMTLPDNRRSGTLLSPHLSLILFPSTRPGVRRAVFLSSCVHSWMKRDGCCLTPHRCLREGGLFWSSQPQRMVHSSAPSPPPPLLHHLPLSPSSFSSLLHLHLRHLLHLAGVASALAAVHECRAGLGLSQLSLFVQGALLNSSDALAGVAGVASLSPDALALLST